MGCTGHPSKNKSGSCRSKFPRRYSFTRKIVRRSGRLPSQVYEPSLSRSTTWEKKRFSRQAACDLHATAGISCPQIPHEWHILSSNPIARMSAWTEQPTVSAFFVGTPSPRGQASTHHQVIHHLRIFEGLCIESGSQGNSHAVIRIKRKREQCCYDGPFNDGRCENATPHDPS